MISKIRYNFIKKFHNRLVEKKNPNFIKLNSTKLHGFFLGNLPFLKCPNYSNSLFDKIILAKMYFLKTKIIFTFTVDLFPYEWMKVLPWGGSRLARGQRLDYKWRYSRSAIGLPLNLCISAFKEMFDSEN